MELRNHAVRMRQQRRDGGAGVLTGEASVACGPGRQRRSKTEKSNVPQRTSALTLVCIYKAMYSHTQRRKHKPGFDEKLFNETTRYIKNGIYNSNNRVCFITKVDCWCTF